MNAQRYSPLASLMHRELAVAGRVFRSADWQVSRGARAKIVGASGQTYAPDVLVRSGNKLHLIYMRGWGKTATLEEVLAVGAQVKDIGTANPSTACSACIFAKQPVSEPVSQLAENAGVWVLAPPHCRGYAYYLIYKLLGLRKPPASESIAGSSGSNPQGDA